MRSDKIKRKLKKTWMKMLRAYARGLLTQGYYLEDKAIKLELKLREEEEDEEYSRRYGEGA